MIHKALLVLLLIMSAISVTAQKPLTDDLIKNKLLTPYENYFAINREMIYTQFNKSRYVTGDDIWFTSWVLNPSDKRLSFSTTKLYVELWSGDKKMISRKILYVKGGSASSFFHVPDTLSAGTYCFRAYSNWMRNFYDEKEFNTLITILGPQANLSKSNNKPVFKTKNVIDNKTTGKTEIKTDYDIQFLPESGHFIEGIDNVFGVKVTNSFGHGVLVKGKVVDSTNEELSSFATNQMGIANFTIDEATNHSLHSIIELPDGSSREVKLPKTERQGVAINVNAYLKDVVWIRLQTNKLTQSLHQTYILMVHANGVMYNNYKINFTTSPSVQFKLNKKDLGNGIIYATLFNEDLIPVAERLFYNHNTTLLGKITFKALSISDDTYKLTLSATDSLAKAQIAKFSLSILPGGTLMNKFSTNMLVESILRPALKGDIENPWYYFEKNTTDRAIALDNLLLTQGWRKYNWPEILKNSKKPFIFPSELEFSINGVVKNWIKNKPEANSRISVISPQNNLLMVSPVDNTGQFHFTKLNLKDSTYIIASASGKSGAKWNRVLQMTIPETILKAPDFNPIQTEPVREDEINEEIPKMTKGVIKLAEVVITANKKNPFGNNPYVGFMSRQFELTKDNYTQYNDIEQILMSYFNVTVQTDETGKTIFNLGRSASLSKRNPTMTIDGVRVYEPYEILTFPLNMVEAIAVDKTGNGGMGKGGGVIAITTRTTPLFEMKDEATNMKRLTVNGYSTPKEYFEPMYLIQPENPDYSKYAALYWKPEIVTDSTGTASFSFKVPQPLKTVDIRAEGINFDGMIFLNDEKIALPGRENN